MPAPLGDARRDRRLGGLQHRPGSATARRRYGASSAATGSSRPRARRRARPHRRLPAEDLDAVCVAGVLAQCHHAESDRAGKPAGTSSGEQLIARRRSGLDLFRARASGRADTGCRRVRGTERRATIGPCTSRASCLADPEENPMRREEGVLSVIGPPGFRFTSPGRASRSRRVISESARAKDRSVVGTRKDI